MAYFAELNENNIVLRVVVIDDKYEQEGIEWCENCFNGGIWVQTSYTGSIRKNYAGVGYTYDANRDAFIEPKPFDSWVLNEETYKWESSIPFPMTYKYGTSLDDSENDLYNWDEETLSWIGPLFFNEEVGKWEVK